MSKATLLDIAKLNGNDKSIGLIEEGIKTCPELANFPSRLVKGTSYTYVARKGRPTVGFRAANNGIAPTKSEFEQRTATMKILAGRVETDKAVADAYEDGPDRYNAIEAAGVAQAVMETVGEQVWYGTSAGADGFEGLQSLLGTTAASSGGRVIVSDTTSGSNNTSVYLVRYGDRGVSFDFGNYSTIDLSDFRIESIVGANGEKHPGYVADISGWIGMKLTTLEGAMRIANVRAESGKAGLSDKIIAEALSYWKGAAPDAIYMNRTAAFLLQTSRSVTTMQGPKGGVSSTIGPFAPAPTESNNIPIVITDALGNSESFLS